MRCYRGTDPNNFTNFARKPGFYSQATHASDNLDYQSTKPTDQEMQKVIRKEKLMALT